MKPFLLLLLTLGASAQIVPPQVKTTGNLGPGGIFPPNNFGVLTMTDTDYTMGYPATSALVIQLNSSVSLTASRKVVAPLSLGYYYLVYNDTTGAQTVNFCGATGTCAAIPNDGYPHLVSSDGVNYYTAASSVGVTSVSVATANGLQGSSSGGASPVLTIGPDGTHVIPVNTGSISTYLNGTGTYTIPSTGVSGILPGTNVTCTPFVSGTCVGAVTVNASGGSYSLGGTLSNANCSIMSGTSLANCTVTGLDGNHYVSITTGSGSTPPGPLVTITFTASRGHNTYPIAQGVLCPLIPAGGSGTSYTLGDSGGLSSSTTYTCYVSAP